MTMHKALYPKYSTDYVSRKVGGREFTSVGDCVVASIQGLEIYINVP